MADHTEDHLADFRARWPEWAFAQPFLAADARAVAAAWFALLQVLTDAAWGGSDPTPGLAKLAWWQEELAGWSRGARRHPLGELLQKRAAPWRELGLALRALPATRGRPGEADDGEAIAVFADAVARCERALFAPADAVDGAAADAQADAATVAWSLVAEHRLAHPETAADAVREPPPMHATRPRRIHLALQRARRDRRPSPPLRALWHAWRAARNTP